MILGDVTRLEIMRRLDAAGVAGACSFDAEGNPAPREPDVEPAAYDQAAGIIAACIAGGQRRFKTPVEQWDEFATLPPEAVAHFVTAAAVILAREFATRRLALGHEIAATAGWLLEQTNPDLYDQLQAAGRLQFDVTTVDP